MTNDKSKEKNQVTFFGLLTIYEVINIPNYIVHHFFPRTTDKYYTPIYGTPASPSIINYTLLNKMSKTLTNIIDEINENDSINNESLVSYYKSKHLILKNYLPYLQKNLQSSKWYHICI